VARRSIAVVVVLLAIVVAAILWLPRGSVPPAGSPRAATPGEQAPRGDRPLEPGAPARAQDTARVAIEAGTAPPIAPAAARAPYAIVTGRVVGARRMPVAGATVELRIPPLAPLSAVSGSEGHFEIAVLDPVERASTVPLLVARAPGLFGMREAWLGHSANSYTFAPDADERPRRVDAGAIAMLPSSPLHVRVAHEGRAVAGALVTIEIDPFRRVIERRTAGAGGVASFDSLPGGLAYVRATAGVAEAMTRAYLPDDAEIALELAPHESREVEVADAVTKAPIAGAAVELSESFLMAARSDPEGMLGQQESWSTRRLDREPVVTGPDGRARIDGVARGARIELRVRADGYVASPRDSVGPARSPVRLKDASSVTRVELEPVNARTVRWPVVAGEVPPPPDGASISVRRAPGSPYHDEDPAEIGPGRMQGATLALDRVEGAAMLIAEAPDGALASLYVDEGATDGEAASFRRPRRIEVTVRDRSGRPVRGAGVTARNQANNPLCGWIETDGEGRATLAPLFGGLADVYVAPPEGRSGGTRAGSVDLDQGDGRIDATIAGERTARLALRIDGAPALPERFRVTAKTLEEFPERGELRVSLTESQSLEPVTIGVRALGFLPASVKVAPPADGAEPVVTLDLARATELRVRLHREPSQRVEIAVERWNEARSSWENDPALMLFNGLRTPNGPGESFVIAGLGAGRWRAIDRSSGAASDPVEVVADAPRAVVDLYVAVEQWVAGRVEFPPGASASSAVVLVDGAPGRVDAFRSQPGETPPAGAPLAGDGSFRVRVPGDREVTVRPWHPWLAPAADGALRTTLGRDGVVLRLVEGPEVQVALAQPADTKPLRFVRVGAYRGPARGEPVQWIHAPIANGVARFGGLERGRWTLWLDPVNTFAPLVIEDVEVGAGVAELPARELARGASIRVRVLVPADQSTPRIYVHASAIDAPSYYRSVNSRGEALVVLGGLGAGRFKVGLSAVMGQRRQVDHEVDLDGRSELVLDLDLR
jgi:hypothetical protein